MIFNISWKDSSYLPIFSLLYPSYSRFVATPIFLVLAAFLFHSSLCNFVSFWADAVFAGCLRYSSQSNQISRSTSSLHFFRRCHIQFFVAKLATAALSKGTHPVLLEKNKNKFGEGFPRSKFVQCRYGFIFVGIPLYYGTFSCLAVLSTVKFKY